MKNLLIIGGDSFISNVISSFAGNNYNIYKTTRRETQDKKNYFYLDLNNEDSFKNIINNNFDYIFLLSSQTNIKECEVNSSHYITNVKNLKILIKFIKDNFQSKIYFFSTSAVFSKNSTNTHEFSPLSPDTNYGEYKANVEDYLMSIDDAFIVRLTKLISIKSNIVNLFFENKLNKIFNNLLISPISSFYLFNSIEKIINHDIDQKIIHLANEEDLSYESFFNKIDKINRNNKSINITNFDGLMVNHQLTNKYTHAAYDIFPETIPDFFSNLLNYEI